MTSECKRISILRLKSLPEKKTVRLVELGFGNKKIDVEQKAIGLVRVDAG